MNRTRGRLPRLSVVCVYPRATRPIKCPKLPHGLPTRAFSRDLPSPWFMMVQPRAPLAIWGQYRPNYAASLPLRGVNLLTRSGRHLHQSRQSRSTCRSSVQSWQDLRPFRAVLRGDAVCKVRPVAAPRALDAGVGPKQPPSGAFNW